MTSNQRTEFAIECPPRFLLLVTPVRVGGDSVISVTRMTRGATRKRQRGRNRGSPSEPRWGLRGPGARLGVGRGAQVRPTSPGCSRPGQSWLNLDPALEEVQLG